MGSSNTNSLWIWRFHWSSWRKWIYFYFKHNKHEEHEEEDLSEDLEVIDVNENTKVITLHANDIEVKSAKLEYSANRY